MKSTWDWISSESDNPSGGVFKKKGHLHSLFYLVLYHTVYAVLSGLVAVDAGTGFCTLTPKGVKLLDPEKLLASASKAVLQGVLAMQQREHAYTKGLQESAPGPDLPLRAWRVEKCLTTADKGTEEEKAAARAARVRRDRGGTVAQDLSAFFKRVPKNGGAAPETAGEASGAASKEHLCNEQQHEN